MAQDVEHRKKLLGRILKEMGLVTESQIQEALAIQKDRGGAIGEILVERNYITREDLTLVDRFDHPDQKAQDDKTYLVVNNALGPSPDRETVYQVIRNGAVLGSVYKYRFSP